MVVDSHSTGTFFSGFIVVLSPTNVSWSRLAQKMKKTGSSLYPGTFVYRTLIVCGSLIFIHYSTWYCETREESQSVIRLTPVDLPISRWLRSMRSLLRNPLQRRIEYVSDAFWRWVEVLELREGAGARHVPEPFLLDEPSAFSLQVATYSTDP